MNSNILIPNTQINNHGKEFKIEQINKTKAKQFCNKLALIPLTKALVPKVFLEHVPRMGVALLEEI